MSFAYKFLSLGRQNLKKDLMYRADFLFSIIITPLTLFVYYFVWKAVYASGASQIAGYTFSDMMTYMVYGQIISIFIFNAAAGHLQQKMQNGSFSDELLKPIHPFTALLAEAVSSRTVAFFLEVIPITIIMLIALHPAIPHGLSIPLFIVGMFLAFLINYMLSFIVGLICAWTVRVEAFSFLTWIMFRVFSGEFFPLTLLPLWAQAISHFLPFEYLRFRVAQIAFLDSTPYALITVLSQLVWVCLLGMVIIILWRAVVRKLTIAGG